MKTILLATALALTTTTALAGTVKVPKEYLGTWCVDQIADTDDGSNMLFHYQRGNCPTKGEGEHTITVVRPDAITYYAGKGCKLVSSKWSPPYGNGVVNFVGSYRCNSGMLTAEMGMKNDLLYVRVKRSDR
jgi:hypothetical protein